MANDPQVTIRMGTEEIQYIEDYLADHPEVGNRSLFIRNLVREHLNRDAEVETGKTASKSDAERDVCVDLPGDGKSEILLGLSRRFADALRRMVEEGTYESEGELIRALLREKLVLRETIESDMKLAYAKANANDFQR